MNASGFSLSTFSMTGRIYAYALQRVDTQQRPPTVDEVAEEFGLTYGAALSIIADLKDWRKWPTNGREVTPVHPPLVAEVSHV